MSKRLLVIGLMALLATSCGVLGDPEEQTIINLDDIYEISLHQDLKPGGNSLILDIATAEELQCPNGSINVYRTTLSNELSIRINSANEIADCEPKLVRIKKSVSTQLDKGNFAIQFIVNSIITDSGRLDIENDYFELSLTSFDGITLKNPLLQMVPDNAIWGVLYTLEEGHGNELQNAEDQLVSLLDTNVKYNGSYGYFTNTNDEVEIHHSPNEEPIEMKPFLLSSGENLDEILEWKVTLESTYPNVHFDMFHGAHGKL